jgi:hypothetical protein
MSEEIHDREFPDYLFAKPWWRLGEALEGWLKTRGEPRASRAAFRSGREPELAQSVRKAAGAVAGEYHAGFHGTDAPLSLTLPRRRLCRKAQKGTNVIQSASEESRIYWGLQMQILRLSPQDDIAAQSRRREGTEFSSRENDSFAVSRARFGNVHAHGLGPARFYCPTVGGA